MHLFQNFIPQRGRCCRERSLWFERDATSKNFLKIETRVAKIVCSYPDM